MAYATSGGVRIHYRVVGQGPPVVLHVGYLGRLEDWSREDVGVVQALEQSHRLVLIDPRGFGASDKPHDPDAYLPVPVTADVVAVLDDLELARAHFWGYSRGGTVGFALAHHAPDRLLSLVIGGAHPYGLDVERLREHAAALRRGSMAEYLARFFPGLGPPTWLANDPQALAAEREGHGAWPSREGDLPKLDLPVLLYCGEQDTSHELARRAAAAMPRATFVSLPGLNHAQTFRARDAFLPHVLPFLARATPPAPERR